MFRASSVLRNVTLIDIFCLNQFLPNEGAIKIILLSSKENMMHLGLLRVKCLNKRNFEIIDNAHLRDFLGKAQKYNK